MTEIDAFNNGLVTGFCMHISGVNEGGGGDPEEYPYFTIENIDLEDNSMLVRLHHPRNTNRGVMYLQSTTELEIIGDHGDRCNTMFLVENGHLHGVTNMNDPDTRTEALIILWFDIQVTDIGEILDQDTCKIRASFLNTLKIWRDNGGN